MGHLERPRTRTDKGMFAGSRKSEEMCNDAT